MMNSKIMKEIRGLCFHFVGIKGTGMAALAELFLKHGGIVHGSDTTEHFYTDTVLTRLGIPYKEGFSQDNIPEKTDILVHSSAYDPENHPEIIEAKKRGITVLGYNEALGLFSKERDSSGIAGVHGKTTTTAMAGTLIKGLGLPASVLVGSAVPTLGGGSTFTGGKKYFIAETCEYKRHFLSFSPVRIVLTSVEPDHLDYFTGYDDILLAFVSYGLSLPAGGEIIYCNDDAGAREAVKKIKEKRGDIQLTPYGRTAEGFFKIDEIVQKPGRTDFSINGVEGFFSISIPGKHTVLNAAAAAALIASILTCEKGGATLSDWEGIKKALSSFRGSSRRSEILGEAKGVLFMDDYGHHPTAIDTTIRGIKSFFPDRRLVVDFMSHTYSRTRALLSQFSKAFSAADEVIVHKIYPSAREKESSEVTGKDLFNRIREIRDGVRYFHEVLEAADYLEGTLKEGDLFLTMGAGDNWKLGKELFLRFEAKGAGEVKR